MAEVARRAVARLPRSLNGGSSAQRGVPMRSFATTLGFLAALACPVLAQTPAQSTQTSTATQPSQTVTTATSDEVHTRPATTTFLGDTGLWYVPTGEVLP